MLYVDLNFDFLEEYNIQKIKSKKKVYKNV